MIEIFWHGDSKIQLNSKDAKVGFNLADTEDIDLLIYSSENKKAKLTEEQFMVDTPGEYEVKAGMAYSLISENGKISKAFQVVADTYSFFYCDNFEYLPNQDQLDAMGTIDVAFIPVAGNKEAENHAKKLVELLEPRIIIPIGADEDVSNKVCDDLASSLGLKCEETQKSFKIKSRKDLPDETQEYVVLEKM